MHTTPIQVYAQGQPRSQVGLGDGRKGSRTQRQDSQWGEAAHSLQKRETGLRVGAARPGKSMGGRRLLSWWEGAVPGPTRRAMGHRVSLGSSLMKEEGDCPWSSLLLPVCPLPPALGYFRSSSENTAKRTH